ncbi:hypothetical protein [Sphingomonas sp. BK235]|uniref:hypothetical protein n=1 Tax=Sphingomonas sp. BK235 TaxID=2512131 RepID=UPI00104D1D7A|nr:hypothetical protein [Sphingomonas sp. BK235]TCP33582.1 hypothetical protein EV292_10529 [Sphingomonas sp. BK235]
MTERARLIAVYAQRLRAALGTRAIGVAAAQRDAAEGAVRAEWDAIVAALARADADAAAATEHHRG